MASWPGTDDRLLEALDGLWLLRRAQSARDTFLLERPRGSYAAAARRTLEIIDDVHRYVGCPRIPLGYSRARLSEARLYLSPAGHPLRILVSTRCETFEFVLLHEAGHLLDHQCFGAPGEWSSLYDARFEGWWRAVQGSQAYAELERLLPALCEQGLLRGRMREYFGSPQELWARSYAQWIALRSDDATLRRQLEHARAHSYAPLPYLPEQWADEDFEPIALALDELLGGEAVQTAPERELSFELLSAPAGEPAAEPSAAHARSA
jgi:hypothetical protein